MPGRVFAAVGVQGAFVAVAMVWRHLQGASAWHDGAPLGTTHAIALPLALSFGALAGVAGVGATRALALGTSWGRRMHGSLREAVLGLRGHAQALALLAVSTAVGEELLFRGAVLPTLTERLGAAGGVALSSLAFGALHVPSSRRLVPWTLTACAMGVVFALLYMATGEVLAPIAAHAVINHENLHFLLANEPGDRAPAVNAARG